jgi:hypothetical protein
MKDSAHSPQQSQVLADKLEMFAASLLSWLDAKLDKRLVRTLLTWTAAE